MYFVGSTWNILISKLIQMVISQSFVLPDVSIVIVRVNILAEMSRQVPDMNLNNVIVIK